MDEKMKNQKNSISILIIVVFVLGLIYYGHYSYKHSESSQPSSDLNLESRVEYLENEIINLDDKLKTRVEVSIEHLKLSQNLQKQVNMLEATQIRQDIDINILSKHCTQIAIESISMDINRLRESKAYSADFLSALENLFNYYIQTCK